MFRTVPLSIIRSFHCTHSNGIRHIGLLIAGKQDQDGTAVPSWSCLQAVSKPVWHIPLLCVQWKTPSAILILLASCQQTCMTYTISVFKVKTSWWWTEELSETCRVSFQNKFEKLVHLVGFIIRNLSRCTVTWTANSLLYVYYNYLFVLPK